MREKYLPAIAILGVIIGAVGIGFGGYLFFLMQTSTFPDISNLEDDVEDVEDNLEGVEDTIQNPVIKGVWYDNRTEVYFISTVPTEISKLSVIITVGPSEKVYISFTCLVWVDSGDEVQFWAASDGTKISTITAISRYNLSPISLQGITTLSIGTHNITIQCKYSGSGINAAQYSWLYVHTYM